MAILYPIRLRIGPNRVWLRESSNLADQGLGRSFDKACLARLVRTIWLLQLSVSVHFSGLYGRLVCLQRRRAISLKVTANGFIGLALRPTIPGERCVRAGVATTSVIIIRSEYVVLTIFDFMAKKATRRHFVYLRMTA